MVKIKATLVLDTYMSLMKTYPERGSELNDVGSMVHIYFGTLSQSDYNNGDPSLEFWCYAGMNFFLQFNIHRREII